MTDVKVSIDLHVLVRAHLTNHYTPQIQQNVHVRAMVPLSGLTTSLLCVSKSHEFSIYTLIHCSLIKTGKKKHRLFFQIITLNELNKSSATRKLFIGCITDGYFLIGQYTTFPQTGYDTDIGIKRFQTSHIWWIENTFK